MNWLLQRLKDWNPLNHPAEQESEQTVEPADRCLSYQRAHLQGIGTRSYQEDSFAFADAAEIAQTRLGGIIAVVADGMGGMEDGKRVSEAAIERLLSEFSEMDREEDLAAQLRDIVIRTGERVYEQFQGRGGTTLAVCMIEEEKLYWASVGDSYLYLRRGEGLYRLNREHNHRTSLYLDVIRNGSLDITQADDDPEGPRLSEFIGKESIDEVDMSLRPLPLQAGDMLLLCSDGIGGVLDRATLLNCLRRGTPAQICTRLEERILSRKLIHQDNYTALVISCGY